jgi:hypothetical protein
MRASTIRRWLRDTVTVTPMVGVDEFGQPLPSTVMEVAARVERAHRRSVTVSGEEFTSTTQVATLHPLKVGDTVTIDGEARPVRAVQSARGLRGDTTVVVAML